jgi:hypothetical protein
LAGPFARYEGWSEGRQNSGSPPSFPLNLLTFQPSKDKKEDKATAQEMFVRALSVGRMEELADSGRASTFQPAE